MGEGMVAGVIRHAYDRLKSRRSADGLSGRQSVWSGLGRTKLRDVSLKPDHVHAAFDYSL
ncbi:hypothetical protein WM16_17270 [Burkholderia ubonensis]|uniref:Uncharacterized protein n=1 Tax=Burkholderia ubonensis TaxID=101571 RepID=A0A108CDY5_9BURK|nr:hypothetical protein WM16_17270 [Burkholderia ubonensis]